MPSGATPGASQPATDGSLTFSASQAPSGASLVEHAGQLTWLEKHCQLTLPQAKGWKRYDTLHLHLEHAEALAAMGLPDDGSNRSESCSTPSSLSSLSPTDQRVREQIQAARARKLLRLASSTPGIYAWAARAAPPRPTTRSRPSQAKRQRTQPAMMKGPLPTRFTIQKTIRSTRTRSVSTTTRRVDGPWKRCGPSGKDFRGRVITSWSDPGRRGRMGKRDVITLEVLNSADEWVTRDEV